MIRNDIPRPAVLGFARVVDKVFTKVQARLNPRLKKHGYHLLIVNPSGSMSPTLVGGEIVLCESPAGQVDVGDVIGFIHPTLKVQTAHRVTRKDGERIQTQGDSCPEQDEEIDTNAILGRIVAIFRPPLLGCMLRIADHEKTLENFQKFQKIRGQAQ